MRVCGREEKTGLKKGVVCKVSPPSLPPIEAVAQREPQKKDFEIQEGSPTVEEQEGLRRDRK